MKQYLPPALLGGLLLVSCQSPQESSFASWYKKQELEKQGGKSAPHQLVVRSNSMLVDTIYRSMQGPYDIKELNIEEDEQLIWLTGYSSVLVNDANDERVSDGFMCHNNLNISREGRLPWKSKTIGSDTRLFTLTEGQTSIRLPEGFGIPITPGCQLDVVSQVLNHNYNDTNLAINHELTVEYKKESELTEPLTPLYQQAVFVTRQLKGPPGQHSSSMLCYNGSPGSGPEDGKQANQNCTIKYKEGEYNPYRDDEGRTFTGHWKLPLKEEVLRTNVTQMLNLPFSTTVHYIGVHLHPFAKSLELWDISADTLLFKAYAKGHANAIGIKHIDHYSSATGFKVYKDHQYELRSTYQCTDTTAQHTAMATMFLYLHDKK